MRSRHVGCRSGLVLATQEGQIPPSHARTSRQGGQRTISKVDGMKFATTRPYSTPEAAAAD